MATTSLPSPAATRVARAVPAVASVGVLLVLAGVASFLARGAPFREIFDAWVFHNAPVGLMGAAVFGLALRRDPTNAAARWFFVGGMLSCVHVATAALLYARFAARPALAAAAFDGSLAARDVPGDVLWPLWTLSTIWVVAAAVPMTLGLLYFPDGRLLSPRWRPVVWLSLVGMLLAAASYGWGYRPWSPHPVAVNTLPPGDTVARTMFLVGMPALGLAGLLAVASLVARLRGADPAERRRIRPVVVSGSMVVAVMVLLYPWQGLWAVVTVPAVMLFVGTTAASVSRYRLFDVEVVVSRAVATAVLALTITLTYVGIVAGIGGLLGARASLWTSVAATAVIAVGFEPVRRRVLEAANRLVLGAVHTPYEVLDQLSDRLARADSTDEVLQRVVALLVGGTGAARAEVRSRRDGTVRLEAAAGEAPADAVVRSAPVTNAGDLLGEVRLLAARDDRFLDSDDRLLLQVAAMVGPVLRNAGLTLELREHIEQLQASRQRIVTAHDEARRMLERDIHDGAQQQLMSLRLRLGLAMTLAEQDGAERSATILAHAAADAESAIRQLRDLARGLYPPMLAEQGLATALRSRARDVPLPVAVHCYGVGRYTQAVESTVYFCCLEAMQNATKHAAASLLQIEVEGRDDGLGFTVVDDGRGFDAEHTTPGAGLRNMRDRIEGIGGVLEIESAAGSGTTVRGWVPAHDREAQPLVSDR